MNRWTALGRFRVLPALLLLAASFGPFQTIHATPSTSFTFAAVGDFGGISTTGTCTLAGNSFGTGSCAYQVLTQVGTALTSAGPPGFLLSLGDMGYNAENPQNWCSSTSGIRSISGMSSLALVAGNHDTFAHTGSLTYLDGSTGTAADTITNETPPDDPPNSPNGFLDNTGGYVSQCEPPSGITWFGSSVTSNSYTCQNTLTSPSCYSREYYFDYPPNGPIMRFIVIPAGICGAWFNAPSGCPLSNYKPSTSYTGWKAPTSGSHCPTDTTSNPPSGSEHYCWLKARIDEAKDMGLWIAIANHKQCLDDDANPCESTLDPFNLALTERGGVDLWLNGHDHSYQRSVQLSATSPCTGSGVAPDVVTCTPGNTGCGCLGSPYTKGGTVVNTIATGGKSIDTNIYTTVTTQHPFFSKECGSNGDVGISQTTGCPFGGVYGFTLFTVNNDAISASFTHINSQFTDSYAINLQNPPADFAMYTPPKQLQISTYSSIFSVNVHTGTTRYQTVSFTSFGGLQGNIVLTWSSSSPSTAWVSFSPATVTIASDGTAQSTMNLQSIGSCSTPSQPVTATVTVTASLGAVSHTFTFLFHIYLRGDVNLDGIDDIQDLSDIATHFGLDSSYNSYNALDDINNDQVINIVDLVQAGGAFGTHC